MPSIIDAGDRLHVLTRNVEWTILRGFDRQGRGPCAITDVRSRRRPWPRLVTDGGEGHTVNDPRFGGLFGFGLVAALNLPALGVTTEDGFWRNGWEITTRLPGEGGFGVTDVSVGQVRPSTAEASCLLLAAGKPTVEIEWRYDFRQDDRVDVTMHLRPLPTDGLWWKEPKLVFNGLHGYRHLTVTDQGGATLERHDLEHVVNPQGHTLQIARPDRHGYRFEATGVPSLQLTIGDTLDTWRAEAEASPGLSPDAIRVDGSYGPAANYCTTKTGGLLNRTEVTRWSKIDICGLLQHGWEGGYGAPDCWPCLRPPPTSPLTVHASAAFGA